MKNKVYGILLLMLLIAISFFKDKITPDYRNTEAALFLDPHTTAQSDDLHPGFWALALIYSAAFIVIPAGTVFFLNGKPEARITFLLLSALCIAEYIMVASHSGLIMEHILPKVNRYFHSPVITLFLIAAFRINQKQLGPDR